MIVKINNIKGNIFGWKKKEKRCEKYNKFVLVHMRLTKEIKKKEVGIFLKDKKILTLIDDELLIRILLLNLKLM